MDKGKLLEKKCQELFKKKGLWFMRLHDTRSASQYLPAQPSDFLVILPEPVFIECKETDKLRIPLNNFRPSQLKAMRDLTQLGVRYYVIILYKKKLYYLLQGSDILKLIKAKEKSINLADIQWNISLDNLFKGVLYK